MKEGDKLGALTLIKITGEKRYGTHKTRVWECKCDCGNTCNRTELVLSRSEHYHSCGCYTKRNLTPKDSEHMKMCGKARAEKRNINGCNVDMLFRDKPISTNTSGVQGIAWSKSANKWHVYIGYKNKRYNLGFYQDFELAKEIRATALKCIKKNIFEDYYNSIRREDNTKTINNDKG